jgi:hypothetical protein
VAAAGDEDAKVQVPGEDCEERRAGNASRINRIAVELRDQRRRSAIGLPYVDARFILTTCRSVSPEWRVPPRVFPQGELQ